MHSSTPLLSEFQQSSIDRNNALPHLRLFIHEIIGSAKPALTSLYRQRLLYKKAGVMLRGLTSAREAAAQLSFLDTESPALASKKEKLMKAVDGINLHYGKEKIRFAAEGIEQSWKMKRGICSRSFTTDWNDLLIVT